MGDLNDTDVQDVQDDFPAWMAQLPDEYKKDDYGKNYKTMGEFYKTHKGLRAKLDKVPQPPEKATEYEFTPEEGIEVNPDVEKWFRKTAFSLKIPKDTASKLFTEYNKMVVGQVKVKEDAEKKALEKADELMHGEWKEDFDKNMKYVDKAIEDLGGEDLRKILDDSGLGNNPVILNALKQVGFEHSEHKLVEGTITVGKKGSTLDDEYPSMKGIPDRQ